MFIHLILNSPYESTANYCCHIDAGVGVTLHSFTSKCLCDGQDTFRRAILCADRSGFYGTRHSTEDPRYNDSVCYQRFCCKIEFAVIKKLDMDPSKA